MKVKLLVGGLLASAVAVVMFVGSLAAMSTEVNVLNLALSKSQDQFSPSLSALVGSDLESGSNMTGTVTGTLTLTGTNKIAEAITNYFSGTLTTTVTVSDVLALHNEGWGFGEIFKLYLLAAESGKSPDEIKAMRDSGMGWGVIAMSLNLSPGNGGKNLGAAVSGRGVFSDTQTTTSGNGNGNGNSHGNPHGGPPGLSGGGGPPSGKGKGGH